MTPEPITPEPITPEPITQAWFLDVILRRVYPLSVHVLGRNTIPPEGIRFGRGTDKTPVFERDEGITWWRTKQEAKRALLEALRAELEECDKEMRELLSKRVQLVNFVSQLSREIAR